VDAVATVEHVQKDLGNRRGGGAGARAGVGDGAGVVDKDSSEDDQVMVLGDGEDD
jgi:hypothetical protein